jgi:hypothetical protein
MQEMGDFKELADMDDAATSQASVMEEWIADWKGKAEQLLTQEPSVVSDLAAEDSSQVGTKRCQPLYTYVSKKPRMSV